MRDHEKTSALAVAALDEYARTGSLPEPDRIVELTGLGRDEVDRIAPDEPRLRAVCQRYMVEVAARQAAGVPEYDRFTLQERLGTFVFILLDVIERHESFVRQTLPSPLTGPLNPFEGSVRRVLRPILDAVDVPSVNRFGVTSAPSAAVAANGIVWLIRAWIRDDSEEKQRSTALIDRSLSLMAASMTNPVPQRGIELLRYGVEAGYLPLDRIPVVGDWFRPDQDDVTGK
ncbi:MAG: hypothetical protein HKN17_02130 [Rhodothermales bacterium]|nr:hypothetical protein [Rhodothermales bacterium]